VNDEYQLGKNGHKTILDAFEYEHRNDRLDKEPRELLSKGFIYCSGPVNEAFLEYRKGFMRGLFEGNLS